MIVQLSCKNCGASIKQTMPRCEYCGSWIEFKNTEYKYQANNLKKYILILENNKNEKKKYLLYDKLKSANLFSYINGKYVDSIIFSTDCNSNYMQPVTISGYMYLICADISPNHYCTLYQKIKIERELDIWSDDEIILTPKSVMKLTFFVK